MANGVASNVITSAAQTIAGRAVQTMSGGLKRVSGNLSGVSINRSGWNNPNSGAVGSPGKSGKPQVKHFSYPSDVDSDPMQGHYIIFNISSLSAAILKAEKRAKDVTAFRKKATAEANLKEEKFKGAPPGRTAFGGITKQQSIENQVLTKFPKKTPPTGKLNRSIQLDTMPRATLETSIALYMPPAVSVAYGIDYAEEGVGGLAEVGSGVIKAFTQGGGDTLSKLKKAFGELTGPAAGEAAQTAILKGLDLVAPGATTVAQLEMGKVITPRMELMFKGVGRRSFSYTFMFIPKSVKEAQIVEEIIYTFKENMHPEYANATTRKEMKIPNTFEITYMYQNGPNDFLNKISTCFLKSMEVQYGADRFTAYESTKSRAGKGPPPQKTSITLGFSELEILSKAHIQEGY